MTPSPQLVIGCSEQLPNQLRAYRLMGTASNGGFLLSRHGATYSAAQGEVSDYGEMLEHMLGLVLGDLEVGLRSRARAVLTRRWNRDWGVETEDLIQPDDDVRVADSDDRDGGQSRRRSPGAASKARGASSRPPSGSW
jgi:hypothetical protein